MNFKTKTHSSAGVGYAIKIVLVSDAISVALECIMPWKTSVNIEEIELETALTLMEERHSDVLVRAKDWRFPTDEELTEVLAEVGAVSPDRAADMMMDLSGGMTQGMGPVEWFGMGDPSPDHVKNLMELDPEDLVGSIQVGCNDPECPCENEYLEVQIKARHIQHLWNRRQKLGARWNVDEHFNDMREQLLQEARQRKK